MAKPYTKITFWIGVALNVIGITAGFVITFVDLNSIHLDPILPAIATTIGLLMWATSLAHIWAND